MSMNLVTLLYLIASVCFIQALKGLSHPATARRGNAFGMTGMAIAALTTVALISKLQAEAATAGGGFSLLLAGLVVGGGIGAILAKRVEMTKMPELVAAMHSLIGLAAVCIAIAAVSEPKAFNIVANIGDAIPIGNRIELFIGTFVGAITFSGSVIAFGKLAGKYKFRLFQGAPVVFAGQHKLNLVLGLATVGLGLVFTFTERWDAFFVMLALAFVMGVLIIIRPGSHGFHPAIFLSILNAFLYAGFNLMTRRLVGSDNPVTTQLASAAVATLLLAPFALWHWQSPDGWQTWLIVVAAGVSGGLGHMASAMAHRYATAAVLGPFLYQQIIYMTLGGWLVFGQIPDSAVALGACIVILSGLYLLWREFRKTDPLILE